MIKKRILIGADDLASFQSIRDHMKDAGTDICCAVSAAGIFDSFMEDEYCLTILKVQSPNSQTIESISQMRKSRPSQTAKIITH